MLIIEETGQVLEQDKINKKTKHLIDYNLFINNKCKSCGENILSNQTAIVTQSDNILNVKCRLDYKEYKSIVCWDCRPAHKLNANSVLYNVLKFGITEEEALGLIHSRNKSPFYKCNHDSEDSYKKFQNHEYFTDERKKDVLRKQKVSREKYHQKILDEGGSGLMKEIKDSSSLNFYIKKYGDVEGPIKFSEKNEKTRSIRIGEAAFNNESMKIHLAVQYKIYTEEDLKNWFKRKTKNKNIISTAFFINRTTIDKHSIPIIFGCKVFNIKDKIEFFGFEKESEFIEKRIRPNNKGYTYTGVVDGHFLRSGREIALYKMLVENDICVVDTNKSYPSAGRNFYDISICVNGVKYYIEIIGSADLKYQTKLLGRKEKYGSLLLEPKYYNKFLDDIRDNKDISTGIYNDW